MQTPTDAPQSPNDAAHLCGRLMRMLLASGADASYALARIELVARALGQETHIVIGDGGVLVTAGDLERFATRVSRTLPTMGVDLRRIAAINEVIGRLRRKPASARAIDVVLDDIERRRPLYRTPVVILAVAITAASLARLFGATWPVVADAFLAGAVSTTLRRRLATTRTNALSAIFVVAMAGGLVAALALRIAPGESPTLALTAAGMILVPGVPLITGMRDLVDGHAAVALSRLALAVTAVLTIAFALHLAATVAGASLPIGQAPGRIAVTEDALFSATAVIGYVALFDLPLATLPYAMACGVASHATRTALSDAGVDLAIGSLIGALLAGVLARVAAERHGMPAVAFAFPGTVAMIPGSYGFRAGVGGLKLAALGAGAPPALVADTIALSITTVTMTAAIAIGLCLAFACPLPATLREDD